MISLRDTEEQDFKPSGGVAQSQTQRVLLLRPILNTPLKNPLEGRVTILRVLRSLQFPKPLSHYDFDRISDILAKRYRGKHIGKVNQRLFGTGTPKKVLLYPADLIPELIEILKKEYRTIYPKPKRPRL